MQYDLNDSATRPNTTLAVPDFTKQKGHTMSKLQSRDDSIDKELVATTKLKGANEPCFIIDMSLNIGRYDEESSLERVQKGTPCKRAVSEYDRYSKEFSKAMTSSI